MAQLRYGCGKILRLRSQGPAVKHLKFCSVKHGPRQRKRVLPWVAIERITEHGVTQVGEHDTDLMQEAGAQLDFQKRGMGQGLKGFPTQVTQASITRQVAQ